MVLKNVDQLLLCINQVLSLTIKYYELDDFVQKIVSYPGQYAYGFIKDFDEFQKQLFNYSTSNQQHNLVITPTIDQCQNCNNKLPNWFTYKNSDFGKDPILYTTQDISK